MVTTFTCKRSLVRIDAAILSYRGNRTTPPTHPLQTHRQDRLQYTVPLSLAHSAINIRLIIKTQQIMPTVHYVPIEVTPNLQNLLNTTEVVRTEHHFNHLNSRLFCTCSYIKKTLLTLLAWVIKRPYSFI